MKDWYRELAHLRAFSTLTVTEIAQQLGKARNTVSRALHTPDVQALVAQLQEQKEQEIAHEGTEVVTRCIEKSWKALEDVLDMTEQTPHKVTAALGVLKGTGQLIERTEQDVRKIVGVITIPARVPPEEWDTYLEKQRRELEATRDALESDSD